MKRKLSIGNVELINRKRVHGWIIPKQFDNPSIEKLWIHENGERVECDITFVHRKELVKHHHAVEYFGQSKADIREAHIVNRSRVRLDVS